MVSRAERVSIHPSGQPEPVAHRDPHWSRDHPPRRCRVGHFRGICAGGQVLATIALAAASAMARLASSVLFQTKRPRAPTVSEAPSTTPAIMRVRLEVGGTG